MNILIAVIIAAIVAYVAYLIALAVPFLAGFATIVGLSCSYWFYLVDITVDGVFQLVVHKNTSSVYIASTI